MSTAAPSAAAADAPYWEALAEGRLVMQHCQGCGEWKWPAVSRCGDCGTWHPVWEEIPLTGVVFSWTKNWQPFGGTEGIGVPFVSVLAALPQAGNKRLLGLFEGDDSKLDIDLPLKGRVDRTSFAGEQIPAIRWSLA